MCFRADIKLFSDSVIKFWNYRESKVYAVASEVGVHNVSFEKSSVIYFEL